MEHNLDCVISENVHTHSQGIIGNFHEDGDLKGKTLKGTYEVF